MKILQHNQTLFFSIERVNKSYRKYTQKQIISAGYNITIDQLLLFMQISEHTDISQVVLAENIFKNVALVTRTIELLVKQGFLNRFEYKTYRRKKKLILTKEGVKIIEKLSLIIESKRKNALKGLAEPEIQSVAKILNKIATNCGA